MVPGSTTPAVRPEVALGDYGTWGLNTTFWRLYDRDIEVFTFGLLGVCICLQYCS
jgi:hypothetical protein